MQVSSARAYSCYPDIVILCGKPEFADERTDTITNPIVVFEVLSPSTEIVDHSSKLTEYRQIPSLQAYFLIAQAQPHIERYLPGDSADWLYTDASVLDSKIAVLRAGTLNLAEVYRKVSFVTDDAHESPPDNDA